MHISGTGLPSLLLPDLPRRRAPLAVQPFLPTVLFSATYFDAVCCPWSSSWSGRRRVLLLLLPLGLQGLRCLPVDPDASASTIAPDCCTSTGFFSSVCSGPFLLFAGGCGFTVWSLPLVLAAVVCCCFAGSSSGGQSTCASVLGQRSHQWFWTAATCRTVSAPLDLPSPQQPSFCCRHCHRVFLVVPLVVSCCPLNLHLFRGSCRPPSHCCNLLGYLEMSSLTRTILWPTSTTLAWCSAGRREGFGESMVPYPNILSTTSCCDLPIPVCCGLPLGLGAGVCCCCLPLGLQGLRCQYVDPTLFTSTSAPMCGFYSHQNFAMSLVRGLFRFFTAFTLVLYFGSLPLVFFLVSWCWCVAVAGSSLVLEMPSSFGLL